MTKREAKREVHEHREEGAHERVFHEEEEEWKRSHPKEHGRHKRFGHSKKDNVERRTVEAEHKVHEPSFEKREKSHSKEKWMQHASKSPGKTRAYLERKFGERAFNKKGDIKMSVLNEAIRDAKEKHDVLWEKRLVLARTYKHFGKEKEAYA